MIDFKGVTPLACGLLGVAMLTTSFFTGLAFVGTGLVYQEMNNYGLEPSFEIEINELAEEGPVECLNLMNNLGFSLDNDLSVDSNTPPSEDALQALLCYEEHGEYEIGLDLTRIMRYLYPNDLQFANVEASFHLLLGQPKQAQDILRGALSFPQARQLPPEVKSMMHNNYAWAMLSETSPNFHAIDHQILYALNDENPACAYVHTKLTIEFAKIYRQPSNERDYRNWRAVRSLYEQCLDQFVPNVSTGTFENDNISTQVVSTAVMDTLLLGGVDVNHQMARKLKPAQKDIAKYDTQHFCQLAMGLSDPYVQGACQLTISQAQQLWLNPNKYNSIHSKHIGGRGAIDKRRGGPLVIGCGGGGGR